MHLEMVISDLDKTFLKSDGTISEKNFQTMQKLKQKKIITAFATGRSIFSVNKVIPVDFPVDYVIFSTGLGIMDFKTKKIIKESHLSKRDINSIYQILHSLQVDFMIQDIIPKNHFFYYKNYNHTKDFLNRIKHYSDYCEPFENIENIEKASQFIAISESENDYFKIKNMLKNYKTIRATSPLDHKTLWIEIFPRYVSKGFAVRELSEICNVKLNKIFSIGNDYNDLEMLEETGISYVVENAPAELKENFKVTLSNDEDGFAFAIDELNIL